MWKIDRDYLYTASDGHYQNTRVGRYGGRRPVAERLRWRVLDDDGEVYYGGWSDEGEVFGPLDFATADAGATEIQYRDATGEWVRL